MTFGYGSRKRAWRDIGLESGVVRGWDLLLSRTRPHRRPGDGDLATRQARRSEMFLVTCCKQRSRSGRYLAQRNLNRDNHSFGDEIAWWGRRAIDPLATSRMLWVSTRRIE